MAENVFTDDFFAAAQQINKWAETVEIEYEENDEQVRAICRECHTIHAPEYEIDFHLEMDNEPPLLDYCCFCGKQLPNAPTISIDPKLIIFDYDYSDWFEDKNGQRDEYEEFK